MTETYQTSSTQHLNLDELTAKVETCQHLIETGRASDKDYIDYINCQLELAQRGCVDTNQPFMQKIVELA